MRKTKKMISVAIISGLFLTGSALADMKSEMRKCLLSIEIVKEMKDSSDRAEKEIEDVNTLIEISETLCEGQYFDEVDKLLGIASGILETKKDAENLGQHKEEEKNL